MRRRFRVSSIGIGTPAGPLPPAAGSGRGSGPLSASLLVALGFTVAATTMAGAAPPAAGLAKAAKIRVDDAGRAVELSVADGSDLTPDDITAIAHLSGLRKLEVLNCRIFNDAMVEQLSGLTDLDGLAITNSGLTDAGVQTIVASFPNLVELDLSSNTNMTGAALKAISGLQKLERLSLLQNRFDDLSMRRLAKLQQLRTLDLRGNMEAGDLTLELLGSMPQLTALKHRSTAVTDQGMAGLARSRSLESLLIQDFAITNASGPHLASLSKLGSLELFRCQGMGTEGVLALAGLPLSRLTLRDLPDVGDPALDVVAKLPRLKKLFLHELASVGDQGLKRLADARELEVLDIWSLPLVTDATVAVIAGLPNLKELSIRETGVSEASVGTIAAMPRLQVLTFKNNGPLSAANAAKLAARGWSKLDLGTPGGK